MSDLNIIWKAEIRKVADLIEFDRNPRKISEASFKKLKERIKKRGFHDVIKIDTDNVILSGHQRKRALMELEIEEVNVLVPHRKLEPSEIDLIVLESNRNDGQFDFDILANEFEMEVLQDVGFSETELGLIDENLPDSFSLPDGAKEPFQQMTFTVSDEQATLIKSAMDLAKNSPEYSELGDSLNKNSNGNALYIIVKLWLEQKK